MHQLTTEQELIITFPQRSTSNLMIHGRAGSAKTYTIVQMAQNIIGTAVALAFNKTIADELKSKLPPNFTVLTLNGLGHRAWANVLGRSTKINLDSKKISTLVFEAAPNWGLIDREDIYAWVELVKLARMAGYLPEGEPMAARRKVTPTFSHDFWEELCFQADIKYDQFTKPRVDQILLASIKHAYKGHIDFDDQIYMSVYFGGVFPQFPTVMVDEAQDLSPANHLMVERTLAPGGRLIVVGDPFQSIYAFRGAASDSMDRFAEKFKFEHLKLTMTFRCPKSVVKLQNWFVPDYRAAPDNGEGEILEWDKWSLFDIPANGTVLCRNNAPLFKLALKCLRHKRSIQFLGRDLGANLEKLFRKICDKQNLQIADAIQKIEAWALTERTKLQPRDPKLDTIADKEACLKAICAADGVTCVNDAVEVLQALFVAKGDSITFASAHKAKGLEWDWVMHLDPWRIPSKYAETDEQIAQENNARYVLETRTKHTLCFASINGLEERDLDDND